MFKHFFAFLSAVGMVGDTLIPILVPPDHLAWIWWRIAILACAILALGGIGVHLWLQASEEKEDRKQRQESDKRFERFMTLFEEKRPGASASSNALRDKALQLGKDLFAFLREKGPRPNPRIGKHQPWDEGYKGIVEARGPYVEAIHYGYLSRFKQRTIDLYNELHENGIKDFGIEQYEVDPPQVASERTVRKIAESLFLLAARMDVGDASKGT